MLASRSIRGMVLVSTLAMCLPFAAAQTPCHSPTGSDVAVCNLTAVRYYGTLGDTAAFSIGTTSVNVGDESISWFANNPRHPVIAQNLYRLKDGRIEQLGQSWLKHGFESTNTNECGCNCDNPHTGTLLGPGCSDTYVSSLNGDQTGMGPRSAVNPHTGSVIYPYPTRGQTGDVLYKRIQVSTADLDPAQNVGARYFAEGQYVSDDDAADNNQNNNATYREASVSLTGSTYAMDINPFTSVAQQPAIRAWQAADPTVLESDVQIADDGLLIVASNATDLGNNVFHYEYAVYNMNADRGVGSFQVPVPAGLVVSNVGFHAVASHSGEPYSNDPWTNVNEAGDVTWSTVSFDVNPNANAIRWGTLYNFFFDANAGPTTGGATLGLFKPGTPDSVTATVQLPAATVLVGDLDGDCDVDLDDLATLLANYGSTTATPEQGDLDNDADVDLSDLAAMLVQYGATCP